MNKTIKELNLEDDFLFAKVMTDQEVCKRVLEKILAIKIDRVVIPQEQKVIDLLLESKGIRLDIYVHDEQGTVYNVEMQRGDYKNLAKRSRYYQGNIDLDLISKGQDYRELKKSFVIFICTFDPFNKGRHIYTFKNRCMEDADILLEDETSKVFLNTEGTMADVDEEMLEFLGYIQNSNDDYVAHTKSNLVKTIHEKVVAVKQDQKMEVEYMTLLERDRLKFEEGMEQGIEKGIEQGIEKGIEQGIEQGERTKALEVAKNLLEIGMEVEQIAKVTQLSKEEILALK